MSYVSNIGKNTITSSSEIHQRGRYTIETIGKISLIDDERKVISFFKDLLKNNLFHKIQMFIFYSMGKLTPDKEVCDTLLKHFNTSDFLRLEKPGLLHALLWALGRQAHRGVEIPVDIDSFTEILPDLYELVMESGRNRSPLIP